MLRILPAVLLIALVVYALIDCVRTPDDDMPAGIPKLLWVVLIVVFPGIAAIAWIVVSRTARATAGPAPTARPGLWSSPSPQRAPRRSGPLAPDDDPEFLARLEADRRRAERERRREIGHDAAPHLLGPGDDGGGEDDRPDSRGRGPQTPGAEPGPTAQHGDSPAGPERTGPATPHSPDEGTSEDGTSPSSGASQN